jgi:hypothetical protein
MNRGHYSKLRPIRLLRSSAYSPHDGRDTPSTLPAAAEPSSHFTARCRNERILICYYKKADYNILISFGHYTLFHSLQLQRTFPFSRLQTVPPTWTNGEQKKMERLRSHRRAYIVQLVDQRDFTGRMLTMEAHLHTDYVVVLWKIKKPNVDEGCLRDYIVRYTFDNETYRQVRECMQRFDKGRYCTFGHHCVNNISVYTSGENPTYVSKQDTYSLNLQWVRDTSFITCHCPEVISSRYHVGELITVCCFKHSNLQNV